jgi:hypothetical protein
MRTKSEKDYLADLIKEIEKSLSWGALDEWTNKNHTDLCEDILNKTGVRISISSIRRLFTNEISTSNPQIETKNALAVFAGYKNWSDFKKNKTTYSYRNKTIVKTAFFVLIFTAILLLLLPKLSFRPIKEITNFSITPKYGEAPLTVNFKYSIPKSSKNAYSVFFGEYFHERDYIKLDPKETTLRYTYYRSYYYRILLKKNGIIIDNFNVIAKSDNWDYGAFSGNHETYLPLKSGLLNKSGLYISPKEIDAKGIDTLKKYYVEFKKVDDFNCLLDSLTIKFKIKQGELLLTRGCYDANIWLSGKNEDIRLNLYNNGCESLSENYIAGNKIDGRFKELDDFSLNLKEWNDVKIKTGNNKINVYINEKNTLNENIPQSCDSLKLIHFFCTGSTIIKDIELKDHNNQIVYSGFNN